jgi:hypothetical protein
VKLNVKKPFLGLLLGAIYAIGVSGILASGGSSSGSGSSSFTCALSVQGIAPLSDGTVWAGVFIKANTVTEDRVVLFDNEGSELLGYVIGTRGSDNSIRALALAIDGTTDVYVGGDFQGGLLRLNADGTRDALFDVGSGFNDRVTSIAPLANGQVYVGGLFTEFDGNLVSGLVRLNNDGSWDNAGFIAVGVTNVEGVALATDAPSTGFVYTAGSGLNPVERWSGIAQQDTDYNPSFNPVFSLIPAADATDAVYYGGGFSGGILRVNSNGSTDASFSVGAGFDDGVLSIDRAAAGDIYAGGAFSTYQGASFNGIVRLDRDGGADSGFVVGSGFSDPGNVFQSSKVASVAQATDGSLDVFVGGSYTQYRGVDANGILRLDNDGAIDEAFDAVIAIDGDTCSTKTIPR